MRYLPTLRALWPLAVIASLATCGFDPRPKSGVMACKPQGTDCCPEGYVCVGRGTSADGGISPGTCWNKKDLPLAALAVTHDQTPANPSDPACQVTDWLPSVPGTGGAGGWLDGAALDVGAQDVGWLPPTGTGGSGGGLDSGVDAPLGQDAAPDMWLGTGGSAGTVDVRSDLRDVTLDANAEARLPGPLDGAPIDAASDTPLSPAFDGAADVPTALDGGEAAVDVPVGSTPDADSVDASPGIITSLSVGQAVTCAVIRGGVYCRGTNMRGELGDGTTAVYRKTFGPVLGLESGATAVAAGGLSHVCAVVNGGVKCWGENYSIGLGDGTTTASRVPVQVIAPGSGATSVSVGSNHACAVVNDKAWCWGGNSQGQLGDGSKLVQLSPVQVVGLPSPVTVLSCADVHTCAVGGGGAYCWGENLNSNLGSPLAGNAATPVAVWGTTSGVTAISAGSWFGCAVVNGGTYCWGSNGSGTLGYGGDSKTVEKRLVPVTGLGAGVTQLSSNRHTCAIVYGGLQCWGYGGWCLGDGDLVDHPTPVSIFPPGAGILAVSIGGTETCVATADAIKCWGLRGGEIDGGPMDRLTPVNVPLP